MYIIPKDSSESKNFAADHPDIVATLRERANELRAEAQQLVRLEIEFANIIKRMHLSPTLPASLESLNAER